MGFKREWKVRNGQGWEEEREGGVGAGEERREERKGYSRKKERESQSARGRMSDVSKR